MLPTENFRRLALLFSTNAAGTLLGQITLIITIPIQLRFLGTEQFGLIALFNAFVVASTLVDAGIGPTALRFIARSERNKILLAHVVASSITVISIIATITAATIIGGGLIYSLKISNEPLAGSIKPWLFVLCIGLSIATSMFASFGLSMLRGLRHYRQFAIVESLNRTATPIIITITAIYTKDVKLCIVASCAWSALIAALTLVYASNKTRLKIRFTLNLRFFKRRMFNFGRWVWIQSIAAYLGSQIDRFVVAGFLSLSALAAYSIAMSIANALVAAVTSGGGFILPEAAARSTNHDWLRSTFRRATFVFSALSATCICLAIPFLPMFLNLWVGQPMKEAVLPLILALLWVAANSITSAPANYLLNAMGKTREAAIYGIAGNISITAMVLFGGTIAGVTGVLGGKLGSIIVGFAIRFHIAKSVFHEKHPLRFTISVIWPTILGASIAIPISYMLLVNHN